MLLESSLGCFLYMPPQHLRTLNHWLLVVEEWNIFYWDNGRENGSYYIKGVCRGLYVIMEKKMETTFLI